MLNISKTYLNWNFERILRHVLYWMSWLVFYVVLNEGVFENGNYSSWVIFEACVLPIKLSFTYITIYYLFPKYIEQNDYYRFVIYVAVLGILGGFLFRAVDYYIISRYLITIEAFLEKIENDSFWSFHIAYKTLDLLFVVSLVLPIKLIQLQARQRKKSQELLTQKLETELQFLKHQLQPHFLFNTLNNLYGMVITQDPKAGDIVIKLSAMMNYMLYDSNVKFINLEKELDNLNNYIALEKLRYGDELEVFYEVSANSEGIKIAPLILISFVENAFKHGISKDLEKSWIKICVKVVNETIFFSVENTLHEKEVLSQEKRVSSGIGLANVKKRLELLYGSGHSLQIETCESFKISLTIMDKLKDPYV
ncbi:MAG: histidine kinase [Bacteroidota bacterium]